jgi:signal transduction histidine kinase
LGPAGPSYRARLLRLVLLTTATAVVTACVAFVINDITSYRRSLSRDLAVYAGIVQTNAAAAVVFDDAEAASQTLEGLRTDERIVAAAIFDADNRTLAAFQRPGAPPPPAAAHGERVDPVGVTTLWVSLDHSGVHEGDLYLAADSQAIVRRMASYGLIALVVLLGSVASGFVLAGRMSRVFVEPVLALARVADDVRSTRDWTRRAERLSDDEVGALTDAFNGMLIEVSRRERDLEEARDRLEQRVEERTHDLAVAKELSEARAVELAHSEARFRSLSAAAPLGIALLDAAGHLLYGNPRLAELLGRELVACAGAGWLDAVPPAARRRIEQGCAQREPAWWCELPILVGPAARIIEFHTSDPSVDGTRVATLVDVTVRRQAELEREALHAELREASRRAGMADVATGVLHNVGNVLNSVNVTTTFLHERLRASRIETLGRAVQLLRDQPDPSAFLQNDPKGKVLPEFLTRMVDQLGKERGDLVREVESLRDHVDHIKNIVMMQQALAKASGVTERCRLQDVVEEALRIETIGFRRHDVTVHRRFADVPDVFVDRHRLLQILINLVTNAKHAMKEHDGPRELHVSIERSDEGGVALTVRDTGVGIPAENLDRIFQHGFTSRKDGHGFGLHSSANAAREMGGSLRGSSAGPGQGATFVLSLPEAATARQAS